MTLKEQEQHLLDHFRKLSREDAHSLLRFAAFLAENASTGNPSLAASPSPAVEQSSSEAEPTIPEPTRTPRPDNERVVDALKRLSNDYQMLEKKKLLDKASGLVAQHIMFGKPAGEVIDQIEKLFADAYEAFVRDAGRD